MFKRANKVTALLVAAASIMSVVPAMAAEHIDTKDGTVKQGIAFQEGQYGYYGYRTDSDETGIWYNKGGEDKDSAIEDLDEYEYNNTSKYGEKYAYALNDSNNDDQYIIDLSTGKVVDEETVEEDQDSAESKLESALKKAERYDGLRDDHDKLNIADADFDRTLTGQFGEVWYRYTTETAIKYENDLSFTTTAAVVLTKEDGKYIDVSVDANMRVYSTKKQRAIVIDKYDKQYNDAGLTVRLNKVQVLAQTKDDIYLLTEVKVYDSFLYPNAVTRQANPSTQYFIQKVSKARGGQDDGAYLPKSVTSYQLDANDSTGIYDNGDAHDAYKAIMTTDDGYLAKDNLYAVKDSTLFVTRVKVGKAKMFKLSLGKVKTDTLQTAITQNKKIEDVDTNLVKKSGDSDHDIVKDADFKVKADGLFDNQITGGSQELNSAVSVDTEGNTWILDTGKVYQYDGSGWKHVYSVDRNSDAIDAYNKDNLMVYEIDGGVYTTVQEGKKKTVDNAVEVDPTLTEKTPATVGWKQEATGWTFYDVNGTKVANYWVNDNGTWYYIKPDGNMATGWAQWNGTWYYLNASGAMQTGWINDNGTWYYCNASGAMLANTTVDGYKLGASGAWVK